jgi:hypothetical protein
MPLWQFKAPLGRTSANCGIDSSCMHGAVESAGWYVRIIGMMLADRTDVGIAVMMKLVTTGARRFMQPAHTDMPTIPPLRRR